MKKKEEKEDPVSIITGVVIVSILLVLTLIFRVSIHYLDRGIFDWIKGVLR